MLLSSQLSGLHGFSTVFNEDNLECHNCSNHDKEHPVGNEAVEHVVLGSTHLSAVELVEDVEPDESVEDQSEDNGFSSGFTVLVDFLSVVVGDVPNVVNEEVHEGGNGEDVDSHTVDLFPHGGGKEGLAFPHGRVSDDGRVRSF